jgi:hypothetical protein
VPRCHTSQLSLAFTGFNEASGGQRGMTLILTNHSGTTCHVYGYPGLAFFDGLPMATHLTWVKESHATVVLHPGGNAQALLTWLANTATGPAPFDSDGTLRIHSRCLDVTGPGVGAKAKVAACTGAASQHRRRHPAGHGTRQRRPEHPLARRLPPLLDRRLTDAAWRLPQRVPHAGRPQVVTKGAETGS